MRSEATTKTAYRVCKAACDIVVSALGIIVLFLPCLILSLFVAKDTGASPIYRQTRMGQYGKEFSILKFRTMVPDADDIAKYLDEDQLAQHFAGIEPDFDPRVTTLGRALRATGLDDLPQLCNVLVGQMSLVGPKAITRDELTTWYTPEQQKQLLSVPCGMTGLYQSGAFGQLTYLDGTRQELELAYVKKASLSLDAKIALGRFEGGDIASKLPTPFDGRTELNG